MQVIRLKMFTAGAVLCLLHCLMLTIVQSSTVPVTCQAGPFPIGQQASVTCNFHVNVTASKMDLSITRYPTANVKIGTDILLCSWRDEMQKHYCQAYEDFELQRIDGNHVTVSIPEVSNSSTGFYKCHFVPPKQPEAHTCTLTLVPSTQESTDGKLLIIILTLCVVIGIVIIILIVCLKCRCRRKQETKNPGETAPLLANEKINKHLEGFKPSEKQLKELCATLGQDMTRAQYSSTGSDTAVQIYSTGCPLPQKSFWVGNKVEEVLVLDVDCTGIELSHVRQLSSGVARVLCSKRFPWTFGKKDSTWGKISDAINGAFFRFVIDNKLNSKPMKAVVIFRFPLHHTSIDRASLASCTKEFRCEDVVGKDLNELLQNAIQQAKQKTKVKLEIVAIVNDATCALMSVAYRNPACRMSVTLGSGFNACYVDKWRDQAVRDGEDENTFEMVYSVDLGALGENGSLDLLRTEYDRELDNASSKPRSQTLETMVSWAYLGELVRVFLHGLRKERKIFLDSDSSSDLFPQGAFTGDHVAAVDNDTSDECSGAERILTELRVYEYTSEDVTAVKEVCTFLTDRAARLAGAGLATLINHVNQPGLLIVVDGELNKKLPRFHSLMYNTAEKLVNPALKGKFFLVSPCHPAKVGAAKIAAAVLRQKGATVQ